MSLRVTRSMTRARLKACASGKPCRGSSVERRVVSLEAEQAAARAAQVEAERREAEAAAARTAQVEAECREAEAEAARARCAALLRDEVERRAVVGAARAAAGPAFDAALAADRKRIHIASLRFTFALLFPEQLTLELWFEQTPAWAEAFRLAEVAGGLEQRSITEARARQAVFAHIVGLAPQLCDVYGKSNVVKVSQEFDRTTLDFSMLWPIIPEFSPSPYITGFQRQ